jgi:hypothetical protein
MKFDFKKFKLVLTAVTPMLLMVIPGGAELAPFAGILIQGIADAEQKPGASGAAKKAYVLRLVADAVQGTNLILEHGTDPEGDRPDPVDADLIAAASGHAVDTIIAVVNAVQKARQAQPAVPALVPAL